MTKREYEVRLHDLSNILATENFDPGVIQQSLESSKSRKNSVQKAKFILDSSEFRIGKASTFSSLQPRRYPYSTIKRLTVFTETPKSVFLGCSTPIKTNPNVKQREWIGMEFKTSRELDEVCDHVEAIQRQLNRIDDSDAAAGATASTTRFKPTQYAVDPNPNAPSPMSSKTYFEPRASQPVSMNGHMRPVLADTDYHLAGDRSKLVYEDRVPAVHSSAQELSSSDIYKNNYNRYPLPNSVTNDNYLHKYDTSHAVSPGRTPSSAVTRSNIELGHDYGVESSGSRAYSGLSRTSSRDSVNSEVTCIFRSSKYINYDHKTGAVYEDSDGPIHLFCAQYSRNNKYTPGGSPAPSVRSELARPYSANAPISYSTQPPIYQAYKSGGESVSLVNVNNPRSLNKQNRVNMPDPNTSLLPMVNRMLVEDSKPTAVQSRVPPYTTEKSEYF